MLHQWLFWACILLFRMPRRARKRTVPESEAQSAVGTVKTKGKKPKRSASDPKRAKVSHTETMTKIMPDTLAQDISKYLMPQVTKHVEAILQGHGLLDGAKLAGLPASHQDDTKHTTTTEQGPAVSVESPDQFSPEELPRNLGEVAGIVAANIAGKNLSPSIQSPPSMAEPPSLHLDSSYGDYIKLSDNVSESFKSKIWSNTYIDMAQLLPNKKKAGYSMSCELDSEGNPGIVWTEQNTGSKLSIEQWTNAFNIFMAVYLEKEGNQIEAPALCKHGDIVRELASLQADRSMYDEQFRKNRARTGRNWANKNFIAKHWH